MRSGSLNTSAVASIRFIAFPDTSAVIERIAARMSCCRTPLGKVTLLLGATVILLTLSLALVAILRHQALQEVDGSEARQHRRIKSFVSDLRTAADLLRVERDECSSLPAEERSTCLAGANRSGSDAVAAARARYDRDDALSLSEFTKLPASGQ